jgi:hypothetical protein
MRLRPPPEFISLSYVRDELMRELHEGTSRPKTSGEDEVGTGEDEAVFAAERLRRAILDGELELFALFSSRRGARQAE